MCRQINSLLDYEKSSQWDYNLGACLEMDLEAFTVRMLGKELNKLNPIFKAEVEAFEDYLSAAATVYDYLIVGKDGYQGSSSTMRWAAYRKDMYTMMRQALEAWNKWMEIRDEMAQALHEDQRTVYLQQTSTLCLSKYQMIKDRNNKYIK